MRARTGAEILIHKADADWLLKAGKELSALFAEPASGR
ncbi:hypothetical protein SAMN04489732_107129 [Amycolatopsis saalfeldensis]|uniref:Uncharacterized protein n=1 Tax=Amycolatopsis saalfeldensis TaxID=394193 RepID=A0A1H8XEF2_9PSEU|nr:hypothetical protein SAMN04489732_107129 [Amycolatopsis saalfeldensis]